MRFNSSFRVGFACAFLFTTGLITTPAQSTTPVIDRTGTTFRVLQSWRVELPDHAITYNRVETPSSVKNTALQSSLLATQPQTVDSANQKAQRMVSLSATVYDRRITVLRWLHGTKTIRVLSNIDFLYVAGVGEIETTDSIYELVLGLGTATADGNSDDAGTQVWLARAQWRLPNLALLPTALSSYIIADGSVSDDPEGFAALNAIHAYYDAHRTQLIQSYQQRMADEAARHLYLRLHPPVVKDTVINFWPKRGSVFLNHAN